MPKYLKEGAALRCKVCQTEDFELSFVDDGATVVYVCQECGGHEVEVEVLGVVNEDT